jgi:hypothetical protein
VQAFDENGRIVADAAVPDAEYSRAYSQITLSSA